MINLQLKNQNKQSRFFENVRKGTNTKSRFFAGSDTFTLSIDSGLRKDEQLPFGLGLNEYAFQDLEVLILAEWNKDKRGVMDLTIEARPRKKVLTNPEKETHIQIGTNPKPPRRTDKSK